MVQLRLHTFSETWNTQMLPSPQSASFAHEPPVPSSTGPPGEPLVLEDEEELSTGGLASPELLDEEEELLLEDDEEEELLLEALGCSTSVAGILRATSAGLSCFAGDSCAAGAGVSGALTIAPWGAELSAEPQATRITAADATERTR